MIKRKGVLTTGQAARMTEFSQQTIIRLFDEKVFPGFRVPRSSHRRIPLDSFIEWMKSEGIPVNKFPQ